MILSNRRNRAFTIVEIMTVSLIASFVLVVLYNAFSYGMRGFTKGTSRLEGLKACIMIAGHLKKDIFQLTTIWRNPTTNMVEIETANKDKIYYKEISQQKGEFLNHYIDRKHRKPDGTYVYNRNINKNTPLDKVKIQPYRGIGIKVGYHLRVGTKKNPKKLRFYEFYISRLFSSVQEQSYDYKIPTKEEAQSLSYFHKKSYSKGDTAKIGYYIHNSGHKEDPPQF